MDLFLNEVIKQLPPNIMNEVEVEAYSSDRINIFRAKNVFSEPRGFNCYKFLVSYNCNHPLHKVDRQLHKVAKNDIFPVNPDQPHGAVIETIVPQYNAILIGLDLIEEIGKKIYGKSEIYFNNRGRKYSPELMRLLQLFTYEASVRQPGYEFILQGLNYQIGVTLLRELEHNYSTRERNKNYGNNKKNIKRVIDYLRANYQQEFSLNELAEEVNYSPFHFIRIFKKETGKTPFEFLQEIKLEKAEELLKFTGKSITEVCYESGFNNRSHFSTVFKEEYGLSPSEYRKVVKY